MVASKGMPFRWKVLVLAALYMFLVLYGAAYVSLRYHTNAAFFIILLLFLPVLFIDYFRDTATASDTQ